MNNTILLGDSFVGYTKELKEYSKTFNNITLPCSTMIGLKNKIVLIKKKINSIIKKQNIKNIILMFGYVDIAGDVFINETQTNNNIIKISNIIIKKFNVVINELKKYNLNIYIINPLLSPFYNNKIKYVKNCKYYTIEKNNKNLDKKCNRLFNKYKNRMDIIEKKLKQYCKTNKIKFINMNKLLEKLIKSQTTIYMGQIKSNDKLNIDHHYISFLFIIVYLIIIYNNKIESNNKIITNIKKLTNKYNLLIKSKKGISFFEKYNLKKNKNKLVFLKK